MTNQKSAKEYFYNKEYNCALDLFVKENNYYAAGLCSLLMCNSENAQKYWSINKKCPASRWGLCILNIIQLKKTEPPSFFQTRAQLEIYLNLLIENNLIEWAQNMVSSCDIFFKAYNPAIGM